MAVRTDCRHYQSRTIATGDVLHRCKLEAAETEPFACPEFCLFFEPRGTAGVQLGETDG
jgi:hypothetical protein